jgi:hypothetical protein
MPKRYAKELHGAICDRLVAGETGANPQKKPTSQQRRCICENANPSSMPTCWSGAVAQLMIEQVPDRVHRPGS